MERIIERCAGLDVHRDTVVVTVRVPAEDGGRRQETRMFGTTISQLLELSEWLVGFGVTLVGMEATGVYWKPVVRHEALCCRAVWDGRRWPVAAGW